MPHPHQSLRIAEATTLLASLPGSRPPVVCATGPRGTGRTTLLRTIAELSPRTATVLVQVDPIERHWAGSGLSALLTALDDQQGSQLQPVLDEALPGEEDALARTLTGAVREAVREPVLLLVDDADQMDPMSQRVLGYLLRRTSPALVTGILTAAEATAPLAGFPRYALPVLTPERLEDVVREVAGPASSPALVSVLAEAARGNAVAAAGLAAGLDAETRHGTRPLPGPLPADATLDELFAPALAACPPLLRRALEQLSAAPVLELSSLGRATPLTRADVSRLQERGLAEVADGLVTPAEPALAASVYHRLAPEDRHRLHAAWLERLPAEDALARPWHAGLTAPGDGTVPALLEAALRLAHADRPLAALQLVERALTLDPEVPEGLAPVVRVLLRRGHLPWAQRCTDLAAARSPAPEDALAEASALLAFLRGDAPCTAETPGRAPASPLALSPRHLAVLRHLSRWEAPEARELLTPQDAHDPWGEVLGRLVGLLEQALTGSLPAHDPTADALAGAARALPVPQPALISLAGVLTVGEAFEPAAAVLEEVIAETAEETPVWADIARSALFWVEVRAGSFRRATEIVEQAEARAGRAESFPGAMPLARAVIRLGQGDLLAGESLLRRAERRFGPRASAVLGAEFAARHGDAAMLRLDFAGAAAQYARARHLGERFANPQVLRCHDLEVECLWRSGEPRRAREELEALARAVEATPSRWGAAAVARCRAMLATGEEAPEAVETVLRTWDSPEFALMRARTMLTAADREGDPTEAERLRQGALDLLVDIGLGGDIADPVHRTETPAGSLLDRLDDPEREVTELVLEGLRNREIAGRLFLSVRTVELRLTSVYRKLGVASRFELQSRWTRDGAPR